MTDRDEPGQPLGADPYQVVTRTEGVEDLVRVMMKYPSGAALVLLRMEHGYSMADLARQRGCSVPAIRYQLERVGQLVLLHFPEYAYHARHGNRNWGVKRPRTKEE